MALLGRGCLLLALALALYSAGAGAYGARARDRRIVASAERALVACFAAVAVASATLWYAFLTQDFSFKIVAETSNRALSVPYRFSAFWASQAGSLLLWLLVLTGYGALVVRSNRGRNRALAPWVTAILGGIASFFALALVVAASPFEVLPVTPADGQGLNTSLQNPYMVAHPPLLYLGYVGFSVPFAYAMAALLARQSDERWIVTTRRWTLAAWGFLGVGMLLGAHWAYVEVGWGGFWAWDAVENAALIPWLVGTAFLHSVIVQEKKGMLKVWNVTLIAATYVLCIFGTFLTRSGVLSSIHSFVESSVGWWFIAWIGIVGVFSVWLISTSLDQLRARHRIESVVSREATFLYNNLLFVALAFAILWGTIFPAVSELATGQQTAVGQPFFDFFAVVFGLPLLALAGIGPVVAWRRASLRGAGRAFLWPFTSAMAAAVLLVLAGYGSSVPSVVALSLCLFVAVTVVLELARGTVARRALAPGTSWPRAFVQLVGRNRRRYGGYIVHLAVVVGIVGIVGTMAYSTVREPTLRRGQSVRVRNYDVTFLGLQRKQTAAYDEVSALLRVTRNGTPIRLVHPARRQYHQEQGDPSNEVDIVTNWRNGEDFYAILSGLSPNGQSATLKLLVNPLVNLLWLGGVLFVAGVAVAIWPDPRLARRVARRYAEERVPAELA
jgi:cytochrome c-type biogenesis protein CcmF